jgi:hypothetical protein
MCDDFGVRFLSTDIVNSRIPVRQSASLQVDERLCLIQVLTDPAHDPSARIISTTGADPEAEVVAYLEPFELEGCPGFFRIERLRSLPTLARAASGRHAAR